MTVGTKVICNGYEGTISKIHDGQLSGMADVRLSSGLVCVDISELTDEAEERHLRDVAEFKQRSEREETRI